MPTPSSPGAAAEDGLPALDLGPRGGPQRFVREAIAAELVASAQDVSGGGLAVAIAEACLWGWATAASARTLRLPIAGSPAVELFGESPSRLVLTCRPRHAPALVLLARQHGLPVEELGTVGGDRLVIELTGHGATGAAEERGSGSPTPSMSPSPTCATPGSTGWSRALGEDGPAGSLPEDR